MSTAQGVAKVPQQTFLVSGIHYFGLMSGSLTGRDRMYCGLEPGRLLDFSSFEYASRFDRSERSTRMTIWSLPLG